MSISKELITGCSPGNIFDLPKKRCLRKLSTETDRRDVTTAAEMKSGSKSISGIIMNLFL